MSQHNTYVECPSVFVPPAGAVSIFLAGGISNCSDWQKAMTIILQREHPALFVLNPRRTTFHVNSAAEDETKKQIQWEYDHLKAASAVLFYFPSETLCPISLLELGKELVQQRPLFVAVHKDYQRRQDVIHQTRLARPDVAVVSSLDELGQQVSQWYPLSQWFR